MNNISDNSISIFKDEIYSNTPRRNRLPKEKVDLNLNIWGLLKDAVGKDLNKFCVPGKYIFIIKSLF